MFLYTRRGLFLVAGAAAIGLGNPAMATVVWVPVANIPVPGAFPGVFLDVVTGATASQATGVPTWDVNVFLGPALRTPAGGGVLSAINEGGLLNLAPGTLIDAAGPWDIAVASGQTSDAGQVRLLGFKFFNEGAAQTQFGWLSVRLPGPLTNNPGVIFSYAYEDSGGSILAGQIPGPGVLAILSAGGLMLSGRRRRN